MAKGIGYGSVVSYSTNGSSWNPIGIIVDGIEFGATRNFGDTTGLGDAATSKLPADLQAEDMKFSVFIDNGDATYVALKGYMNTATLLYWQLEYSNHASLFDESQGYVGGIAIKMAKREAMVAEITVARTGDPGLVSVT